MLLLGMFAFCFFDRFGHTFEHAFDRAFDDHSFVGIVGFGILALDVVDSALVAARRSVRRCRWFGLGTLVGCAFVVSSFDELDGNVGVEGLGGLGASGTFGEFDAFVAFVVAQWSC